jgi:hypothetical protein
MSVFLDIESFAWTAFLAFGLLFNSHSAQFSKSALKLAQMVLSGLILLRSGVLNLNFLDLFSDTHI